jgi:hypothetical protein
MVVVVLFGAGNQVPVIPLFEGLGKVMVPPEQMAGMAVKVGVTAALMVMVFVL